jgi:hypothetical protein
VSYDDVKKITLAQGIGAAAVLALIGLFVLRDGLPHALVLLLAGAAAAVGLINQASYGNQ